MIIQFCGLSGVGKTTLASSTKKILTSLGIPVEVIDGDLYRNKLCKELGFSRADRQENIRRLGFIASRFSEQGIVSLMSVINPYEETRQELAATYPNVKTIFIDCDLKELLRRDTKGLYKRAMLPKDNPERLSNLTGVNDVFEIPAKPDLYLHTGLDTVKNCTRNICEFVIKELGKRPEAIASRRNKLFQHLAYGQ